MTKRKQKPQSPALQLVLHVWEHRWKGIPKSWTRVNRAMYAALQLAITGGLRFDPDDVGAILRTCRGDYWMFCERHYAAAVSVQNYSACESFEKWNARGPIRADNVKGDTMTRQRERLAVGFVFDYAGYRPTVTSFRDGKVIAVVHKGEREPKARRFTLSQEDINRDRADRRWKERLLYGSLDWWSDEQRQQLVELLGRPTTKEFNRLPRKRIEQALSKLGLEVTP